MHNSSEYMKVIIIKKDISLDHKQKEITELKDDADFIDIFEVFEDIVYDPGENEIKNILLEYKQNVDKKIYGYYLGNKIIGIIGVKNNSDSIEVLHFGIHPGYRGKNFGSELMDHIKNRNKTITLETDDDAVIFYKKYGFICTEFNDEKKGKRYHCEYIK